MNASHLFTVFGLCRVNQNHLRRPMWTVWWALWVTELDLLAPATAAWGWKLIAAQTPPHSALSHPLTRSARRCICCLATRLVWHLRTTTPLLHQPSKLFSFCISFISWFTALCRKEKRAVSWHRFWNPNAWNVHPTPSCFSQNRVDFSEHVCMIMHSTLEELNRVGVDLFSQLFLSC